MRILGVCGGLLLTGGGNGRSTANDRPDFMRFLLVDDHPLVRGGLRLLLLALFPGAAVAEAGSAQEAMIQAGSERWDVVFLDVDLPDRSGLDLLHDLRAAAPDSPVLVVSGMLEEEVGMRALEAGAAGFVSKTSGADEIQAAVRRVRSGRKYLSPELGARLLEKRLNPHHAAPHEALSTREFEVLRLLGKGRTVSDIAATLNLSVKTVSTYRTRVLEKLGLTTTAEIVRYSLERGLDRPR